MTTRADNQDWYRTAFSRDYVRIYAHRDQTEARRQVEQLLDLLQIPPGSRCLDLCCGFGRHLAVLLEHNLDAVGIDLSQDLLDVAPPELKPRLQQGDMRALPYAAASFSQVLSFFTSFGYFADDSENQQVVAEIHRVLRPGGRVVFDFLNPDHVRANLVPQDSFACDGLTVTQYRRLNPENNSVDKDLIVTENGVERCYHESVKLYGRDDFERFFAATGLTLTDCFGSTAGAAYGPASKRMIIIGRK